LEFLGGFESFGASVPNLIYSKWKIGAIGLYEVVKYGVHYLVFMMWFYLLLDIMHIFLAKIKYS